MADSRRVVLDVATRADAELLANLLELYIHDLSEVFPAVELGTNGRFGYEHLGLYWTEPERRFAFIVRSEGQVAGFALVTRSSAVSDAPNVFDIAEFFVLRSYRRSGVGRSAAELLWNRLPGKWTVRVSEGNRAALPFWTRVVQEFTKGTATRSQRAGNAHPWLVFAFESADPRSDANPSHG